MGNLEEGAFLYNGGAEAGGGREWMRRDTMCWVGDASGIPVGKVLGGER